MFHLSISFSHLIENQAVKMVTIETHVVILQPIITNHTHYSKTNTPMVVFSEDHKAETCRRGRIEVICGSMFSGKTEELIRRLKRATFAKQQVEIFKPTVDTRYSEEEGLIQVCNKLANNGIRVIIAGLDMDFKGLPFGPMPALCAIADEVTKVHAVCVKCGDLAYISHRTVPGEKQVLLGEKQEYEPLCRCCYQKALKDEKK